ncbi:hypothetical protein MYXO_00420 [Myxococcaceae bacterium]|nr:hypothetical protein MYXO_00420 [Myxococcaceae bacterium]
MHRSYFLALICLLSPGLASALATPVTLTSTSGSDGGFAYSFLHDATSNCITIGGTEFCQSGATYAIVNGSTLSGTLDGLHLYGLSGTLDVTSGPDIVVTDGDIDFSVSAPDTFGGSLTTSLGTFHFLDHAFAGPANSFDGTSLYLWGNNWDSGTAVGHVDPDYGVDLGFVVTVVPEPGTLLLLSAGLAGLGWSGRRKSGC